MPFSEEIDEERSCDEESVSLVGVRVVAIEPLEAIVAALDYSTRSEGRWRKGEGEVGCGMQFAISLAWLLSSEYH